MTVGLKANCSIDAVMTGRCLLEQRQKAGVKRGKAVVNGTGVVAGRQLGVVFQNASQARIALDADGYVPVTLEQLRHGFTVKLTGFASGRR
ncbi:hypothetical protein PWG15_34360 (plasmid) [Ensifer adhaerens]|uniref:hypothetical protein n=1 Tax=Ensifer adhaerens TaxID=106592 RepID=UPI0023A9D0EF|nr:hypothetical protein [Ensifer adhaerens]WDZ81444.1 hypothetical protein PWG15_34360 [Ensifer adhaerens]